jgi:hypothetical protein
VKPGFEKGTPARYIFTLERVGKVNLSNFHKEMLEEGIGGWMR